MRGEKLPKNRYFDQSFNLGAYMPTSLIKSWPNLACKNGLRYIAPRQISPRLMYIFGPVVQKAAKTAILTKCGTLGLLYQPLSPNNTIGWLNRNTGCQCSSVRLQLPTSVVFIDCLLTDPSPLPKRRIICRPISSSI